MRGCWGACMVARGRVWLQGGMVARGMHGCQGSCVVAKGCAWLVEGMCMIRRDTVNEWLVGGVRMIRRDTVNELAVCILLECILVLNVFAFAFDGCE